MTLRAYLTPTLKKENRSNILKDKFAGRQFFTRGHFYTKGQFCSKKPLHGLKKYLFFINTLLFFTITITPNPFPRSVFF